MGRRSAGLLVALAVLAGACGGGGSEDPPSAESDSTTSTSVVEISTPDSTTTTTASTEDEASPEVVELPELTEEIPETFEPTLQEALDEFALAFGTVPGSELDLADDGGDPHTALAAIAIVWDQLDGSQQPAVQAALTSGLEPIGSLAPDGSVEVNLAVGRTGSEASTTSTAPLVGGRRARPVQTTDEQAATLIPLLGELRILLDGRLGVSLATGVNLYVRSSDLPPGESTAWAVTGPALPLDLPPIPGVPPGSHDCSIVVGQRLVQSSPTAVRSLLAHELFHCYQYALFVGPTREANSRPRWLMEGSAAWVGESVVGGTELALADGWWATYFEGQSINGTQDGRFTLFHSDYPAIGYFEYLNRLGVDLWPRFVATMNTTSSSGAFATLNDGVTDRMVAWGASTARNPAWGASWDAPTIGTHAQHRRAGMIDIADTGFRMSPVVPLGANGVFQVNFPASAEVADVSVAGSGMTTWNGSDETTYTSGGRTMWCLGRSCLCPDGTPPSGVTLAPAPAGTPLTVALSGVTGSSWLQVRGVDTDELCQPPVCGADAGAGASEAGASGVGGRRSRTVTLRQPPPEPVDPRCGAETPADPNCIVGSWVFDASTLPIPPAVSGGGELRNVRTSGSMLLTLTGDGQAVVTIDGYRFEGIAPIMGASGVEEDGPVSGVFSGSMRNTYAFTGGSITFTFVESSVGAVVTLTIPDFGPLELPLPPQAVNAIIPALAGGGGATSSAAATCTASTLTITSATGTFTLQRV